MGKTLLVGTHLEHLHKNPSGDLGEPETRFRNGRKGGISKVGSIAVFTVSEKRTRMSSINPRFLVRFRSEDNAINELLMRERTELE